MAAKKEPYKIPFRAYDKGRPPQMMEYVGWNQDGIDWRENYKFCSDLKIVSHYRGRSAARIQVQDVGNGEIYSFGFASFFDAITSYPVTNGIIRGGTYTFRKQGSNYGLVCVE